MLAYLLFVAFSFFPPTDGSLVEIRSIYFDAVDRDELEDFYNETRALDCNEPVCEGYRALAVCCYADCVFNPISKWDYFSDGRDEIERLIAKNPEKIELRFIRFGIQANAPKIANYSDNIEEDFNLIVNNVDMSSDTKFWTRALNMMRESRYISTEQKKQIDQILQ